MKKCKNCEYWGRYIDGACDFVDSINPATKDNDFWINATADDDSNLQAYLMTGPYFGCIHFNEKVKK